MFPMKHIEDWQKILTYIQSVDHSPSISEVGRQNGIHPRTAANILRFIATVQSDINEIEIIRTRRSEFVRIHPRQPMAGLQAINAKVDEIIRLLNGGVVSSKKNE